MNDSVTDSLQLLLDRSSTPARQLAEPAPDEATLQRLLQAAIRVPDHGKLVPWRLLVARGQALREMGQRLAAAGAAAHPDWTAIKRHKEEQRYAHAPLVVAVIARIDPEARILAQEQLLSGACVAHNLLLGAQALGFGAQWLTGWACYDRASAAVLGLDETEHVLGFIHIGTPARAIPPRARPELDAVVSTWTP